MNIGKLKVVNGPRDAVIRDLMQVAQGPRTGQHYACFCEAHLFVRAHREDAVLGALQDAHFVYPDGTSLALGARLTGVRFEQRHPGPVVMLDLCGNGQAAGLKHYFYGGREGVGDRLSTKLQSLFPKIQIVGHESPPFRQLTEQEQAEAIARIEASGADVLWVGLGAPKQELWMQSHLGKIKVPLMMGVGAAFEYFSGDQKWAPYWMRRFGLEWLYRMLTGGPRLFKRYLTYVPLCCYFLIKESLRSRFVRAES
ncbi:WecB/TagA/CpsF family glycosyltransferase [Coraliomargarita sp. SDUM461004]|uniref:WecB/TagA/CpsF family glycosyltransferase n=1 Tax=Thalassobacterium sedimentorum TaxID=3041258 RepID=A0ABU1AMA0_9BACT|nr:WecB/TagA/CpsF family glycosyltransferase [Coraliomargarita sp. SDUM461004]MDQ8195924.1 WecB/TagA/CpsF family glycosyltransferase [Coraliomargarita sp. SDUM461004]